jgi:hypothetical protein
MTAIVTTRALNISVEETATIKQCEAKSLRISSIEPLKSGGTHVVFQTIEEADKARLLFKSALIAGRVVRFPFMGASTRSAY